MDKKGKDCAYWIAVLLSGVALGVVVGIVALSLFYPAFQSDKWAAWVQAFGSVGAILGAIYFFHKGAEQDKRARRERSVVRAYLNEHDFIEFYEEFVNASETLYAHICRMDRGVEDSAGYLFAEFYVDQRVSETSRLMSKVEWEEVILAIPKYAINISDTLKYTKQFMRMDEFTHDRVNLAFELADLIRLSLEPVLEELYSYRSSMKNTGKGLVPL